MQLEELVPAFQDEEAKLLKLLTGKDSMDASTNEQLVKQRKAIQGLAFSIALAREVEAVLNEAGVNGDFGEELVKQKVAEVS